jgi:2'-5' RNA ligase
VLAVRVEDPARALTGVQSVLSAALARGGWYEPESRPFLAHVTIARVARGARVRPVSLPSPPPVYIQGGAVTLFRSRTEAAGARYERLSAVAL